MDCLQLNISSNQRLALSFTDLARSTVAATAQGARVVRARLWVECSVRIATLITPVMFTTDLPC